MEKELIFDGIKATYWKNSVFSKTGTETAVYLPAKQTNKVKKDKERKKQTNKHGTSQKLTKNGMYLYVKH